MEAFLWLLGIAAYLVAGWLELVYLATPLTLASLVLGSLIGVGLAAAGYLRIYRGLADREVLKPISDTVTRRLCVPYPRQDLGWPNYLSWQVEREIAAAAAWPQEVLITGWKESVTWIRSHPEALVVAPPLLIVPVTFLLTVTVGLYATWTALAIVTEIVTAVPRMVRLILIQSLRATDASIRSWRGATTTCPKCRRTPWLPAYRCGGSCDVLHRDIRPGRLGVLWRRCRCGTTLPMTVLRATRASAPFCPACRAQLAEQAGVLPDARIAISGGPGVGKTQLLMTATAAMSSDGESPGTWQPADEDDTRWMRDAKARLPRVMECGPQRTGEPTLLTLRGSADRRPRYVHFADTDGSYFVTDANNAALRHFSTTRRQLLVLDATTIPSVSDRIGQGNPAAEGNANGALRAAASIAMVELPYQLLVAQLSRFGARTHKCSLAIVVAKADLLIAQELNPESDAEVISSSRLEAWLCDVGLRNLVEAAEHDFAEVRYFIAGHGMEPEGSVAPFAWLLSRHRRGTSIP
jgi:Double-GTPase 2